MPCCIDRMRFSPMFYDSAEKSNFFAFFCIFFVFSKSRDLCVAPDFRRRAREPQPARFASGFFARQSNP